uniref:Uncharacterized protein n=1 Tax=Castor canadensis TaxID=51338 RepID=A0A8C0W887_CASCN
MEGFLRPLSVFGDCSTGEVIRVQNVMAGASISNIVKSFLGPVGLDKCWPMTLVMSLLQILKQPS